MNDDDRSDPPGTSDLFKLAYNTLHGMAVNYLVRERPDHTLQPTALLHEAFVKLANTTKDRVWANETHFRAVAANAMRQILVDHARGRATKKRGGEWKRINISTELLQQQQRVDVVALDDALKLLHELDPRKAQVVELRFFGGMTCAEIADQLGVSGKAAEADWYFARAWLSKELSESD